MRKMITILSSGDQPFPYYKRRPRLIAWIRNNLFDHVVYKQRHGLITGMRRKGGLGWVPGSFLRQYETREHAFLKSLNLKGSIVYDIGAFEGLFTIFFAQHAEQVICYEPNTRNYTRLMENTHLNGLRNVAVRKLGIGSKPQSTTMIFNPLMPGEATLDHMIINQLKSQVQLLTEQIMVTTLDQDIQDTNLPAPDFIKLDIEGWEMEALQGARNTLKSYMPALFLETHGGTMGEKRQKVAEIVAFLNELGYRRIKHIETNELITTANSAIAAEGHLYCQATKT